jgi:hypothetical protein
MLKYLVMVGVVLGLAFIIARHDEYASLKSVQESADNSNPAIAAKPNANNAQKSPEDSYWNSTSGHIFHNAFRWPEGTTVWAIILTLAAIAGQTHETAKAAKAGQAAAETALLQLNQTTEKERARIEIRIGPPNINLPDNRYHRAEKGVPQWILTANVLLRNIGAGRAFITRSGGRLVVVSSDAPPPDTGDAFPLILPDSFLDPAPSQTPAQLPFWPDGKGFPEDLSIYGKSLDETLHVRAYGFIEYETMGKRMHHDFLYTFRNAFLGFYSELGGEVPMSEMKRITQLGWIDTGNFDEYEIKAHAEKTT